MMYKKFTKMPPEAKKLREAVFVNEQHFKNEFDAIDNHAIHLVFYEQDQVLAVCRYYRDERVRGKYILGRIAVAKDQRGRHIGKALLDIAEKNIAAEGGRMIGLSAQVQARSFYEKSGYRAAGEVYLDEDCPHIYMEKLLAKRGDDHASISAAGVNHHF